MNAIEKKETQKKYEKVHQDSANANFGAWVGISLTKSGQWINLSLGVIGGKTSTINKEYAMFVNMKPNHVRDLIEKLKNALTIQADLIADQSGKELVIEFEDSEQW